LRTSTGIPTSVCHVFLKSLLQVIETEKPQYLAIAFDLGEPTFRHEADATYKADRTDTPADLLIELENLQELLSALNLQAVTAPGYEADDVLGTLAQRASEAGYRAKIVTGDRDLFQLVDAAKGISVLYLSQDTFGRSAKAIAREFGPEEVKEKLGVTPAQVVDYKALCGDASDNIPGVKGIGDKTAVSLLSEYGSIDGIYAATDNIKGAVKKKLEAGKADAYHSQHLARIVLDVPVEIELEDCKLKDFDEGALVPLLEKFEFKSFLSKIKQMHALLAAQLSRRAILSRCRHGRSQPHRHPCWKTGNCRCSTNRQPQPLQNRRCQQSGSRCRLSRALLTRRKSWRSWCSCCKPALTLIPL
jgi:DNA polymerase-1